MRQPIFQLPVPGEALPKTYARLREGGPIVRVELPGGVEVLAATNYEAVREVLRGDDKVFGKHFTHWPALREGKIPPDWPLMPLLMGEHMLMRDGDAHRRLRGLISKAFTRPRIEALRPRIEHIVDGLLDAIVASGKTTVDLVPLFSEAVPMAVICELFGVSDSQRSALRGYTQTLVSQMDPPEAIYRAHRDLMAYLGDLVKQKRQSPDDDLTTALVRVHESDDNLSSTELVDSLFLLLIAGHETTVHLISYAIINLLGHPSQLARAKEARLWDDVIEETLRRNPPLFGTIFRYALEATEIAGVPIAQGEAVLLGIGGAATDPRQYGPDAYAFDIGRKQSGHVSFGHGVHMCLGAPLARLEAAVALPKLFERLPEMTVAIPLDEIPHSTGFIVYGPQYIPVRVGPGTGVPHRQTDRT